MKNSFYIFSFVTTGILFCFVLLYACNFIEETLPWTKVSGKVIDRNTNNPVENFKITIIESEPYTYKSNIIATIYTDKNGEYSYKFHAKTNELQHSDQRETYWINFKSPINCQTPNAGYELYKGRKNYWIMRLSYNGYFTVHINNQFPFDENDEICLCTNTEYIGGSDCSTINEKCRQGINIDEDIYRNKHSYKGNYYQKIYWKVTKNGITTSYMDSVFIIPCDTVTFNINY